MVFALFVLGIMVPIEATIVPLYFNMRGVGLTNTYIAVILPLVAIHLPFGVLWMRPNINALPPSLNEAAVIDEASRLQRMRYGALPIIRPGIITMVLILFMWTWNDLLVALVMVSDPDLRTAPLSISLFVGQYAADLVLVAAASVILAAPLLLVYVFLQRSFIHGVLTGALRE